MTAEYLTQCPQCGKTLSKKLKKCPKCGAVAAPTAQSVPSAAESMRVASSFNQAPAQQPTAPMSQPSVNAFGQAAAAGRHQSAPQTVSPQVSQPMSQQQAAVQSSTIQYCPNCGAQQLRSSRFCAMCGARLAGPQGTPAPSQVPQTKGSPSNPYYYV